MLLKISRPNILARLKIQVERFSIVLKRGKKLDYKNEVEDKEFFKKGTWDVEHLKRRIAFKVIKQIWRAQRKRMNGILILSIIDKSDDIMKDYRPFIDYCRINLILHTLQK